MTDIKPEATKRLPLPCAWDSGIFAVMGDAAGYSPIRPGTFDIIHNYPLRFQGSRTIYKQYFDRNTHPQCH